MQLVGLGAKTPKLHLRMWGWELEMPDNLCCSPELKTCQQGSSSPASSSVGLATNLLKRPHGEGNNERKEPRKKGPS